MSVLTTTRVKHLAKSTMGEGGGGGARQSNNAYIEALHTHTHSIKQKWN